MRFGARPDHGRPGSAFACYIVTLALLARLAGRRGAGNAVPIARSPGR